VFSKEGDQVGGKPAHKKISVLGWGRGERRKGTNSRGTADAKREKNKEDWMGETGGGCLASKLAAITAQHQERHPDVPQKDNGKKKGNCGGKHFLLALTNQKQKNHQEGRER